MLRDNNKKRRIVVVGKGGGGGIDQVQSDWNQTDNTQVDYIKNKPTVYNEWFGTQAEYDAISVKDPDTIYYIEDASGTVIRDGKTYGIKVLITDPELEDLSVTSNGTYQSSTKYGYDEVTVNVQPNLTTLNATTNDTYTPTSPYVGYSSVVVNVDVNPYPSYLTVHYTVPEPNANFKILNNTNNIAGYRVKGATTWETPATTMNVTVNGTLVLEFNLTDNTKIVEEQFFMVFNVCKVELPATVTTLEDFCFNNCRCMTEFPRLDNVTSIGENVFYSTPILVSKYVINDNVSRSINPGAIYNNSNAVKATDYIYINGIIHQYMNGSFENVVRIGSTLDLSNGIDGLPVTGWMPKYDSKTFTSIKFPSTLQYINEGLFSWCDITEVYFYCSTPPTILGSGSGPFQGSTPQTIYIPNGSMAAYTADAPWSFYSGAYVEMPA